METITLYISGMACGGCANTIANALRKLPGVASADVSHTEGTALVSYDPATVQPGQIKSAIAAAGYQVAN